MPHLVFPAILVLSALFVFGLLVGSFLNVVILRFNTGMSIARGRSGCFSCGKELGWRELIPLASFLAQRGKCKGCGSKISWQYPLVELSTGLCFVAAYARSDAPVEFLLWAALLCFYVVIFAYDLRHKIIPDFFSYGAALIALGIIFLGIGPSIGPGLHPLDFGLRILSGPLFFLFFWSLWSFSRGRWMGLGDGKLALSMGWALGLGQGLSAFLLSFWIGAAATLAIMALQRVFRRSASLGMGSQVPFGPFMLVAFLIVYVLGLDFWTLISYLAL
ncbi:MAG TPA: prepilin peptidase [Candidatus Paceibacterota bacterium]|nr:prepilin peptidase [Candidatus Paceibacterota bacterium]